MTLRARPPSLAPPRFAPRFAPRLAVLFAVLFAALPAPADAAAPAPPWAERANPAPLSQAQARALSDDALIARGAALFSARFTGADGAGRPMATQSIVPRRRTRPAPAARQRLAGPEASACAACHNAPMAGGAGDFVANAFVSDGVNSADFDTLDPQFSLERNTNHLFGAGLLELLAREMTADLQAARDAALAAARASGAPVRATLATKGVEFGALTARPDGLLDLDAVAGVDPDLVIRPFGRKGVFVSLRQFTVNALNDHHGMQAGERFGLRWTGLADFDGDGVVVEMPPGDVSALVAWQASLPPPRRRTPENPAWAAAAEAGARRFAAFGCADCHRPALPLDSLRFDDPGPYDAAGTLRAGEIPGRALDLGLRDWAATLPRDAEGRVLVPLFGDLKRHRIADSRNAHFANELLGQRFVARDVFQTTELWGAADTSPYGHRGDLDTLDAAIRAHGGEARAASEAYVSAPDLARSQIIAFLRSLEAPR